MRQEKRGLALLLAFMVLCSGCTKKNKVQEPDLPSGSYNETGEYSPPMPQVMSELEAARQKNSDVVGWLTIPNIKVNEAVVQTTDNDFYLRRDIEKKYAFEGCYYMDYESVISNDGESLSQNTIIYGHNLGSPLGVKDDPQGVKFAQLLRLKEASLARKTPYIYLTTPKKTHIFEIFAIFYSEALTTPVAYHYANYSDTQFLQLLKDVKARSLYHYDVSVDAEDQILTLSTCSYQYGTYTQNPNQRFVVMGKLMDESGPFFEQARFTINENPKPPNFEGQ